MKYQAPYGSPGGPNDPTASYINGNPSTGTMGSIPPAASIENPQREIVNFITDSLLTPTDADLHQLGRAVQSNGVVYCDDQGTVNQLVITLSPAVTVLTKGMVFIVKSPNINTGPSTLKVNSISPVPIVRSTDQAPLQRGDISPNALLAYGYDGANFQMVWTQRQPGAPIYLTAPQTYYVNGTTGSNSYDGTTATVGGGHGPFQTIQRACNQIPLYNMNGYSITINVADGTYSNFWVPQQNGSGTININGNASNPGNVVVLGNNVTAISAQSGSRVYVTGFKVTSTGPQTPADMLSGVQAYGAGTWVYLDAMEFGSCTGPQIFASFGGLVTNTNPHSPWKVSGGAQCFVKAELNSQFVSNSFAGPDVTILGSIAYSAAFIQADTASSAVLSFGALTGAGGVTGTRYSVFNNSTISGSGGGANYYPGTIAGTSSAGGYYT